MERHRHEAHLRAEPAAALDHRPLPQLRAAARTRKWAHNRALRFDFDEILARREEPTLKATAALLHRESLLPASGQSLLDGLDENSHRHAFGVSEDLKHALRESIELIGNEAIRHLREVSKERVYERPDAALAHTLGLEALRYMYQLLFLFYIEARPMLDYAPLNAEAYRPVANGDAATGWSGCATWRWRG